MQRLAWFPVLLAFAVLTARADEAPASSGDKAPPASAVQNVAPQEAEAVLGQRILDANGKTLGRLVDVLVNAAGQPQAAVIDFGGFMGVGNRKVAVHWSTLHFTPSDPEHKIVLDMTPDQIKAAPEFRNTDQPAPVVTPAATAATSSPAATAATSSPAATAATSSPAPRGSTPSTAVAPAASVPAAPSAAVPSAGVPNTGASGPSAGAPPSSTAAAPAGPAPGASGGPGHAEPATPVPAAPSTGAPGIPATDMPSSSSH